MKHKSEQPEEVQEIVEPLTGSAVIVEPKVENGADEVKNEGVMRKPTWRERWAEMRTGKNRKGLWIGLGVTVLGAVVVVLVVVIMSGQVKLDYSGSYLLAKEVKPELTKLTSATDCEKASDYLTSAFAAVETYDAYVKGCSELGEGVREPLAAVGETEGVLKDAELLTRYEAVKEQYETVMKGNAGLADYLEAYKVWHAWVVTEAHAGKGEWDWTEAELEEAVKVLTESKYGLLQEYGQGWLERKKAALLAHDAYFNAAADSTGSLTELRTEATAKETEFKDWKKENEPQIKELLPLAPVKTTELLSAWQDFYAAVRTAYQENYNREVGGCRELVNQIVCE